MPQTPGPGTPDDSFEATWAEYAAELNDITDEVALDSAGPDQFHVVRPRVDSDSDSEDGRDSDLTYSDPNGGLNGPRDWSPGEEADAETDAETDADEPFYLSPEAPADQSLSAPVGSAHRHSALLWGGALVALAVAVLMAFSVIPGGVVGATIVGVSAFVLAAIAAFATSPDQGDVDPYDDGARL